MDETQSQGAQDPAGAAPERQRLPPTITTIKLLFARSGNRCAYPGCTQQLGTREGDLVVEVCHVKAASPEGPRFDPAQTDEECRGVDNLILLCRNHHGIVDDDVERFPVEALVEMKEAHEARFEAWSSGLSEAETERLAEKARQKLQEKLSSIAATSLPPGAEKLVGREKDIARLQAAWEDPGTHVVSIVAWGGVGKTALVVEWTARLEDAGWPGVERYFDWSFYSQGTKDQSSATGDLFIAKALEHFGDPDPQAGSPHDRGDRLSRLVAERPTLLALDGLEPLQYGPGPLEGQLKDPAVKSLLQGLARRPFSGLCVVTTREPVRDLAGRYGKKAEEWKLEHLSEEAGAQLLWNTGARRAGAKEIGPYDQELKKACEEVDGHALTLQLLGGYLGLAHDGDVLRRDRVRFEKADRTVQGGHAFRVIGAYERLLAADEGSEEDRRPPNLSKQEAERLLAVLRLLGLFDRTADKGCIEALRREPPIEGLTEPLVGLGEEDWNITLKRLSGLRLVLHDRESGSLDAHPLVRDSFARRLRAESPEAWKAGHERLYEHLTTTTEPQPSSLAGLQPLYQAVAHGCLAGLHEKASAEVYWDRINRRGAFYSTNQLGALGADLGAVACFFEEPWTRLSPNLSPAGQAWMLNQAAFRLRALSRLAEAVEPMRVGMDRRVELDDWQNAAISASNLSELELTLGQVQEAVADGARSVTFADRSGDAFLKMAFRTTHADALHQAGRRQEALGLFREAEVLQAEMQPQYPRLYSLQGFWYCDLLLAEAERAVWGGFSGSGRKLETRPEKAQEQVGKTQEILAACREAKARAEQAKRIAERNAWLLDIALDHLTLGRAALYRAILSGPGSGRRPELPTAVGEHLEAAVEGIRGSGRTDYLPGGLLTRAWFHFLAGNEARSREDLDEAWDIAERGGMKLQQADVYLHRARLFGDVEALQQARVLIEETGYERRRGELEDAEAFLGLEAGA